MIKNIFTSMIEKIIYKYNNDNDSDSEDNKHTQEDFNEIDFSSQRSSILQSKYSWTSISNQIINI